MKRRPQAKVPKLVQRIHLNGPDELKRIRCAFKTCKKRFMPKRPHQRFCSDRCRIDEWERIHPRVIVTEKGGARRWYHQSATTTSKK